MLLSTKSSGSRIFRESRPKLLLASRLKKDMFIIGQKSRRKDVCRKKVFAQHHVLMATIFLELLGLGGDLLELVALSSGLSETDDLYQPCATKEWIYLGRVGAISRLISSETHESRTIHLPFGLRYGEVIE